MLPMGSFATGDPSLDELVGAEAKLLDGKVGRLGTLQNLVDVGGSAPETDAYRRVLSLRAMTSKVNAILVYVPTLEGWHLLLRLAVAISRTTGVYALLPGGLSRHEGERGDIGVVRMECSRAR